MPATAAETRFRWSRWLHTWLRILSTTFTTSFRYRVMGLAAETAFYALLSFPPLLFGLSGAIGYIAATFDIASVRSFRAQILIFATRFVTPDVVESVLRPTLDDLLGAGRPDIISVGFLLALWSGSRAIAVFVDTCTIMYGMRGQRGVVKSRVVSLGIYLVFLLSGAIVFPLVLTGPNVIAQLLRTNTALVSWLYWPFVGVGTIALVATLYHVAMPIRRRWRGDLPGALVTFIGWVVGSALLRRFIDKTLGGASLYGPLATPIALMLWLYLISLSVLVGAAFNAAVGTAYCDFAGLSQRRVKEVEKALDEAPLTAR